MCEFYAGLKKYLGQLGHCGGVCAGAVVGVEVVSKSSATVMPTWSLVGSMSRTMPNSWPPLSNFMMPRA